ncbi:multiple myeloma tumor-associated protein 2 [Platysternon megacephalum]|uniref:Multiple myeloma tumor-associated protein 2 n=1 Tax=Platysternon megacephalum TaxID=55544 RepID=A0A4D9E4E8_9SAUR|nr:multiple myeloma tumor-associated protein 2 [Platysternon megacephalum]
MARPPVQTGPSQLPACVLSQPQSAAPGPALTGQAEAGSRAGAVGTAQSLLSPGQDPICLKGLCVLPAVAGEGLAWLGPSARGSFQPFSPTHTLQPVEPEITALTGAAAGGDPRPCTSPSPA